VKIKQNTKIAVKGCGVKIVGRTVVRNTAYITVKTFAAGRISGSGRFLSTVRRRLRGASNAATIKVPLHRAGRNKHRSFRTRVRVGFVGKKRGEHSKAFVTVTFR